MSGGPLDLKTLEAIDVLARAVDRARVPGVLEFRLLANALRRAIDSRAERELHEATRVYQTLDPDFRARIVQQAEAEAWACADRGNGGKSKPPAAGSVRAGSNFLAALNGSRTAPPSSERRQGIGELLPGEPLPRSS